MPNAAARTSGSAPVEIDALLALALSQPERALAMAHDVLGDQPDPRSASIARQTIGIVERDAGNTTAALRELRRAVRAARATGDDARLGDVLATLGVTLGVAGRTAPALRTLARSLELSRGVDRARVLLRRAHVLLQTGRPEPAMDDLRSALAATRRAKDELWQARCLIHRGWALTLVGDFDRARADVASAATLFTRVGQLHEAAFALNNLADLSFLEGDLPTALSLLDRAEEAFARTGPVPLHTRATRAQVLLSAGLAPEALATTEAAIQHAAPPHVEAQLLLIGALAAFETGDLERSSAWCRRARHVARGLGEPPWLARVDVLELQIRAQQGQVTMPFLRQVADLADRQTERRAPEAIAAHLLVGQLALRAGRLELAHHHLDIAARARTSRAPLSRVSGHLAVALREATPMTDRDNPRPDRVLRACGRGLDALHEHVFALGDVELRALATSHGAALAELAVTTALPGPARRLLDLVERSRAVSLAVPTALPPDDPGLAAAVAAAREADARLREPGLTPAAEAQARRDRARHEGEVRRRYRVLTSSGTTGTRRLDVSALVEAVGTDALVCLCEVADALYCVCVHRGRVTRHLVGPMPVALRESEFARFALRRAAYGRVPGLARLGARVEQVLLGDLGQRLPERVVIVPPARLHAAPWGLLPNLAERIVRVAPSAQLWLRARAQRPTGHVVFVGGPELSTEQLEVATHRNRYAGSRMLIGADANAAAVSRALDGARLAHVAAHGSFRADAPLFSSLHLADGPLYLYDLDRLARPPHTMILSACDVGDTAAVGVDDGLGLVTGLLGSGTSAVLASTVPVNDSAAVVVTGHLHEALAGGADLASALLAARRGSRDDPLTAATAAAFAAWGA